MGFDANPDGRIRVINAEGGLLNEPLVNELVRSLGR